MNDRWIRVKTTRWLHSSLDREIIISNTLEPVRKDKPKPIIINIVGDKNMVLSREPDIETAIEVVEDYIE